jgi:predicted nuclease with TOPRIM domain
MDPIVVYIIAAVVAFAGILFAFVVAWNAVRKSNQLLDENTALLSKIDNTEEAQMLRSRLESYKTKLAEAEEAIRQGDNARHFVLERPTLDAERKTLEDTLASLSQKVSSQIASSQDYTKRAEELVRMIANMESERDLLAQELKGLHREQDDLTPQVKALREQIAAAETRVKTLARETAEAATRLDEQRHTIAKLEEQKNNLEKAISALRGENDKLQKRHDELLPKVKEFEAIEKAIESTRQMQREIAKTNELMMKDLATIAESRKTGNIVLRQTAFEGLKHNPPFAKPASDKHFASETDALAQLKQSVRKQQFNLSDRLLHAFHTSLKTSDISSLTVMAGVSGTGKSALPNLYAKAMGIHIVSLAVEPRWDSPKDLLGFFNYVTNRYEATPLARALFQFQGHHQQGALAPDPDLSDYMLLAMLDEMNLARIEYYFSEFLSKLEDRRRGKMDTHEHRRKIGLEVFPGAKGTDPETKNEFIERPIQLFADYNTLFVGTMNEDETTQSLSDKVIDRANVLYFGRPIELTPKTSEGDNAEPQMLRRDMWRKWVQPVRDDDTADGQRFQRPKEVLQTLNSQLTKLGRPFAHRTYQAMLSYLANYPYHAANIDEADHDKFFREPLADQIGMRIMPKLRGLDLTTHSETLRNVASGLASVNDDTLTSGFAAATMNSSGFFQWQGLDWK